MWPSEQCFLLRGPGGTWHGPVLAPLLHKHVFLAPCTNTVPYKANPLRFSRHCTAIEAFDIISLYIIYIILITSIFNQLSLKCWFCSFAQLYLRSQEPTNAFWKNKSKCELHTFSCQARYSPQTPHCYLQSKHATRGHSTSQVCCIFNP